MMFPLDLMADGSAPQQTPAPRDERSLIAAAQAGDCEAFNQLALAHQSRIYSVAYYLLGDAASASDAMQETLLSAYRNLRSFRKGNSLKGWLYRIVTRKCYDLLRDARRRRSTLWDESCDTD
jgi:RNA polymerase sigma-70 factor, ECF subfamily